MTSRIVIDAVTNLLLAVPPAAASLTALAVALRKHKTGPAVPKNAG